MNAAKAGKKKRVKKARPRTSKGAHDLLTKHLALPDEELRRLVLRIIAVEDVEPFVGRMVSLLDGLRDGQLKKLAQVARQSKEPSFARLMSEMSGAVDAGRIRVARNTAFFAASYAYQNSVGYICELMSYLDSFRKAKGYSVRGS